MIEPHLEQRGERGVGGKMWPPMPASYLFCLTTMAMAFPADQALDAALHGAIARICHLVFGANVLIVGAC